MFYSLEERWLRFVDIRINCMQNLAPFDNVRHNFFVIVLSTYGIVFPRVSDCHFQLF